MSGLRMVKNTVKRTKQGWLVVSQNGFQTKKTFHILIELILKEVNKLRAENIPVMVLVDLSRDTGHAAGSEHEAAKVLKVPFELMAIYAPKRKDRLIITALATVHKSRDRVKAFKTLEDAETWLKKFAMSSKN